MFLDYAIISGYLIAILLLGLWSGKGMKTLSDFSVSHRSYGSMVIFATLSASFIGGGFSIGNAEKVYRLGIANIVALWGFSLKEILVAKYIAPRTGNFPGIISVGDIMDRGYGKIGRIVSGFFSVFLCAGIVGAQVGAMGIIFNVFLDIRPIWGILIGCGIVITYSTVGGMRAVVLTDVIQFCVLAIGIPAALVFGLMKLGGLSAIKAAAPEGHFSIPAEGMTIAAFMSLFLTFLLGETLVPPYVQRLFMARDAGVQAICCSSLPAGILIDNALEVTVSDPVDGGTGYVYLFETDGSLDPGAGTDYVGYTFNLLAGDYIPDYDTMNGPNPEDSQAWSPYYRTHFSDRWIRDEINVYAGASTGVDIFDGHKNLFKPDDCGRSEYTFSNGEGAFFMP